MKYLIKNPKKFLTKNLNENKRAVILSVLVGLMAGAAAAAFLIVLKQATQYRDQHPQIIWFLPLAGLFVGWIYTKYGRGAEAGSGLILEEIHNPQHIVPFRMAPFVFLGTVVTHLFGGSAGREGTAVQMGSSLADQLTKFFKVTAEERRALLIAGAGAGFSAAIGAPWAGAIFGLEVIQIGKIYRGSWLECLVASFVAFYFCRFLGAEHSVFPAVENISYTFLTVASVLILGVCFGLLATVFIFATHLVELVQKKYVRVLWRPFLGGLLLVGLFYWEGSYRYVGLGLPEIQQAFVHSADGLSAFYKMAFTALTIGSGFKGGEFVPLVFVGTTAGSFLATILSVDMALAAALGFAAVFGAAANTPLACAVMAAEIFGWKVFPYALLCCWVAYFITGHHGVYKNQKVIVSKKDQLKNLSFRSSAK